MTDDSQVEYRHHDREPSISQNGEAVGDALETRVGRPLTCHPGFPTRSKRKSSVTGVGGGDTISIVVSPAGGGATARTQLC